MLKKFYKIKNFEELLGIAGLLYLLLLLLTTALLIRILITTLFGLLITPQVSKPVPPTFDLETAEELIFNK